MPEERLGERPRTSLGELLESVEQLGEEEVVEVEEEEPP